MRVFDASRIVVARESRGMNQADLASAIGVSTQQLSQWERGEVRMSVDNAAKIMNALQSPATFFFVLTDSFESITDRAKEAA